MRNTIEYRVWGRCALFTDPVTKLGGEKCSYHIPTYEAIKGITESIYWKPTFVWIVDRIRVMAPIRTQTKGVKPLKYSEGGNDLSIYTYLTNVEYQVQAHFEWNLHRPELERDRVEGKHFTIAQRMLDRGGRRDVFLGSRECQAYVEPHTFGAGSGVYDGVTEIGFGLMLHGLDYPDETGRAEMSARFWHPVLRRGIVDFPRPDACEMRTRLRSTRPKAFVPGVTFSGLQEEGLLP